MKREEVKAHEYMTQGEVAQRFRVSLSTIKTWRDRGLLQYFQPPGSTRVLYPVESVAEFEFKFTYRARELERRRPAEIRQEVHGMSSNPTKKEWRI